MRTARYDHDDATDTEISVEDANGQKTRYATIGEAAAALGLDAMALLDALEAGNGEAAV